MNNNSDTSKSWRKIPINSVYSGFWDGPHATPKEADNGPLFLGIKNITEDGHIDLTSIRNISEEDFPKWTKRIEPKAGDIVFTYEATLHRYAIIPKNLRCCLGRRVALIRPDKTVVDTRFLLYYFLSDSWRKEVTKHLILGATVDRIPLIEFPDFEIQLPPLHTQHKIAAILSAYDDLIENNTRRIRILEEMAQTIYREWFVHFRYPGHENVPLVDSPLGEIPHGWEVTPISDVATLHRGKSYRSHELRDTGGLPFLNLKCIDRNGGFRHDGIKRFEGVYKESQTAEPKDIVIALTDMTQQRMIVAISARVPNIGEDIYVMSMDLIKVVPASKIEQAYLYSMLRFSTFSDEVKEFANGVNVLHLNPKFIEDYKFPLPTETQIKMFSQISESIYQSVDNLYRKNKNLRTQRDLLLPRLVSGELDVEELDLETGENTA